MKTVVHTATGNLNESINFYSKLSFQKISEKPLLFTDGKVTLEINPDHFARPGLKLIKKSWQVEVKDLENLTAVTKTDSGYLLSDPNGVWVYLEESDAESKNSSENKPSSVLGNYAGISLESTDFSRSIEFWEKLGFSQNGGAPEYGYITLDNNGFGLSIMKAMACPHLFFNPSMTFFNGKNNLEIIKKIRELKIPITEEITQFNKEGIVDNIIIRDPGGFGFFIFND
ncbi:MAG: hypothetical protein H6627_13640 [Calditrichae bacterium]|nr:hypothetical protein [Calditrichia bacterium]